MDMEFESYIRFVAALAFVLALIAALTWVAKRYSVQGKLARKRGGKSDRLDVIEVKPLDSRRRLVLIKRDDVEHLILLGQTQETVIETGIRVDARTEPTLDGFAEPEPHDSPRAPFPQFGRRAP